MSGILLKMLVTLLKLLAIPCKMMAAPSKMLGTPHLMLAAMHLMLAKGGGGLKGSPPNLILENSLVSRNDF